MDESLKFKDQSSKQAPNQNFQICNFKFVVCDLFYYLLFFIFISFISIFPEFPSFSDEIPHFTAEEVVVTASKLPQPQSHSPWNVNVINANKAKAYGAETVADALRLVPGIDMYATGGKGALNTVRIKGANAEEVLVLLDGCRLNSPLLGTVDMGGLLLDNVERIEVVTSPLSAMYGSDAVGGVINIITRKGTRFPKQMLAIDYGSFADRIAKFSYGREDLFISACYDQINGFRQNSGCGQQNVTLNKSFNSEYGVWRLAASYYADDKGVPGVPNSATDPYSSSTPNNRQQDKNINLALDYEGTLGSSNLVAKLYQNTTDQKYQDVFYATNYTYWTAQNGINLLDNIHLPEGNGVLGLGLEYREDYGQSSMVGNNKINDLAVFANQELQQGPVDLSIGVRVDQHSTAGQSINPRIGICLTPINDLKLWGNIATALKAPTLNELYWNDPLWFMYGDPNLRPENSIGVQVGANQSFAKHSAIAFSLFSRQITDQILWEFDPTTFITQAKNVGRVEVTGADAEFKANLLAKWLRIEVFANATFQTAIDREDVTAANIGKDIPYSPRTKFNLGGNFENPLGKFALIAKHVGVRFADAGNTITLGAYTLVDLTFSNSTRFEHMTINAKINNLFNGGYAESVGYNPTTYAILEYPMPGRSFTVGLSFN